MNEDDALARKWLSRIKQARSHWQPDFTEIQRLRALAAGEMAVDDDALDSDRKKKMLRVNLIHSTIAGLLPHVYARLPEVAVEPKESINPGEYPALQAFSRTLEIVLGEQLTYAQLKRIAKVAVRRCFSGRVAWVKVGWQHDIRTDPVTVQRIEDTQDDILRLEALIRTLEDPSAVADAEVTREELHQLHKSLDDSKEVVVSSGLTIDLIRPEHILIEPHIDDWEDWDKTGWIAHEIPMPISKAKELFPGVEFSGGGVGRGNADVIRPVAAPSNGKTAGIDPKVGIVEVWDKATMTVYTVSDQAQGFVRDPYQPDIVPDRWYPFTPLALNVTDGRFWPLSLTEMLEVLQEEYLETREKYAEHRGKAIPSMIFDADAVSPATARKLANKELMEQIPVNANGRPLDSLVGFTKYPPIDGSLYDTNTIRFDIEMSSGLQDAARGAITRAKTATEADIMQTALTSRVSEMQDSIEDWIGGIAEMSAQMALLAMSQQEVEVITGSGASWPVLDRETVYKKVRVKIRAGTSGKPDKSAQQKAWAQILPLSMDLMGKVAQAEATGQVGLATGFRELLAETLRRLDERFDVDRLLPRSTPPVPTAPPAAPGMNPTQLPAQDPTMNNLQTPEMPNGQR